MKYGDKIQLLHEESQSFAQLEQGERSAVDKKFTVLNNKVYLLGQSIYTSQFTHFQIDPYCDYQKQGNKYVSSSHYFYLNYIDPLTQLQEATAMVEGRTIFFTQFESENSGFKFKCIEGFQERYSKIIECNIKKQKTCQGVNQTNVFRFHFANGNYYINAFYNHILKDFEIAFIKMETTDKIDRNGFWSMVSAQTENANQVLIRHYLYICTYISYIEPKSTWNMTRRQEE